MPKIILKFEAAVLKEIPMLSSTLTVGRDADNDVQIDHPAVSRHHLRIIHQGDAYFVEDLNSTNGTMVNGKKIIKVGIHDQDAIGIAKHSLVFIEDVPAATTPLAPAPVKEAAPAPVAAPPPPAIPADIEAQFSKSQQLKGPLKLGLLRVIEGLVDQMEYSLTENSTYIGKSERVAIKNQRHVRARSRRHDQPQA